jgi:hypothetical protein
MQRDMAEQKAASEEKLSRQEATLAAQGELLHHNQQGQVKMHRL